MTKSQMPAIKAFDAPLSLETAASPGALARWDAGLRAAADEEASISIFDMIGSDGWSEGVTAKRIDAALRSIGKRDVVVNINSPGGDLFEGMAIYNMLRNHSQKVTVRVLGLAASAASVIAMAGDEIQIARAGFLMIHNSWVVAIGNRHDMREVADFLEPFDAAMADVYQARAGVDNAAAMMDAEKWIGGSEAVSMGFADVLLPADFIADDPEARAAAKDMLAVRIVDAKLARAGTPRSERRSLIAGLKGGTHDAAPTATLDAGAMAAGLRLLNTIKI